MISLYEIDDDYIEFLRQYEPDKVLSSKSEDRKATRKYVGIIMNSPNYKYFIPLSSFKPIYEKMYESISFKKIKNMAVLRINNMIPVIDDVVHKIDFSKETDEQYKILLQNEYRVLKVREKEIRRDARIVYHYRNNDKNKDKKLYKICCDFKLLEENVCNFKKKAQTQQ